MKRFAGAAMLMGTMALTAAACGSSSSTPAAAKSSGQTGNSGTSQAAFVSAANAICKSGNTQQQALTQPADNAPLSQWADYLSKFENIGSSLYSQLQGVTPPKNKQSAYTNYLTSFSKALSDVRLAQQAAANNDTNGLQSSVQTITHDSSTVQSDAKSLGLTGCAD